MLHGSGAGIGIGYAALCMIVPAAWGIVMYGVTVRLERHALSREKAKPPNASAAADADGSGAAGEALPLNYNIW